MTGVLELGLDTFGDVTVDPEGHVLSHAQVVRDVVAQGMLADGLDIDVFGIGEHHRADFAVSAPEPVLAAIAVQTARIRLGSAVTVLSSDDPVRVFQRFATLDALSNGRAEVILGRGSFTESFPLFGFALDQYETLFSEKLDLFSTLLKGGPARWSGSIRPPLDAEGVFPAIEHGQLRSWIGVGGSPDSVVRAARYGLPLMLAIIGGDPRRFAPYVDLSRRAHDQFGSAMQKIGVHSMGYVAETDREAADRLWPHYKTMMDRIGSTRGWPPLQRASFEQEIALGSLYVGAPETVARKIAATARALSLDRFDMKYSMGTLPHAQLMDCIGLYGSRVAPMVRDMLAG